MRSHIAEYNIAEVKQVVSQANSVKSENLINPYIYLFLSYPMAIVAGNHCIIYVAVQYDSKEFRMPECFKSDSGSIELEVNTIDVVIYIYT